MRNRHLRVHNHDMDNGLLGALIGGGAACIVAYLTLHHEQRMAREQLIQSRFAPAYLTLQQYISRWADHAKWNLNVLRVATLPEPQLPPMSDVDVAQVSLFASDDVMIAADAFGRAVTAYQFAIGSLDLIRKSQDMTSPRPVPELRPALDDLKATATDLVNSAVVVHMLLRAELRGERHGKPRS